MIKRFLKGSLAKAGFEIKRTRASKRSLVGLKDADLYQPLFSPWLGLDDFRRYFAIAAPRTLVSSDRCYVLYTLLKQVAAIEGDIWECGVYRGGTAAMMAQLIADVSPVKKLYLFDTFEGMPATHKDKDVHKQGDFSDTDVDVVRQYVGHPGLSIFRKGFVPDTFAGLEGHRVAFAHIDVDIYQAIKDACAFIWPRLSAGGFMVFDDYGFPSCPGARAAVDEFVAETPCVPLCLASGQAVVFKGLA